MVPELPSEIITSLIENEHWLIARLPIGGVPERTPAHFMLIVPELERVPELVNVRPDEIVNCIPELIVSVSPDNMLKVETEAG